MNRATRAGPLSELEEQLGVPIPAELTDRFLPMTWDEVRDLEGKGITFGPHTVSHGNSGFWDEDEFAREVTESWARVRAETRAGIPVFCYPYGGVHRSTDRVVRILEGAGMMGALTTVPDYASGTDIKQDPYFISRFSWPNNLLDLRQISSGIERAKTLLARRPFAKRSPEYHPSSGSAGAGPSEGEGHPGPVH